MKKNKETSPFRPVKQIPILCGKSNLPRKLKKKIFGTKNRPNYWLGVDFGECTVESLVFYDGGKIKVIEMWREK